MSWLSELFFGQGVAHSVLMFAIVIALGIVPGKVKVWGISLGITWILFVGIICSHFGMRVDGHTLHFMKEFGLILFVYSVGLQVGPGFFSSFRKGGLTLNMLATGIVLLGVVTTYVIHVVTGLPITTMVGILSGAVTNTPGLGAAQQAYSDMTGVNDPTIALGYAVAYPLGVIGIIGSILLMRVIFRVKFENENEDLERQDGDRANKQLVSRRIAITKGEVNGKMLGEMRLRNCFGVNVTRVNRVGVDLVAKPNLQLQIGDRLTIVGPEAAVTNVAKVLGNSLRRLREPNLVSIFLGIFLGILLGSIPFTFPGIPQPVKLGLAGGPLIISILISRFGPQYGLVTYTTMSANLMLREVGIALFLASVGLGAGDGFVETIIDGGGYAWIGYGFIITVVPLIIIGIIARTIYKVNYFTLMGLMAGSMTDPPALAYSNGIVGNDAPAVSYATVYPLTMFLRVLTAQMLILFFV